jgi:dinuclear metal center YbgI/SA1388 family protein
MHVHDFIGKMERLAPPDLAEDFDAGKIGLVVEGTPEIRVICCALDATPAVVRAAADLKADMLVVHHTPLWTPVTALTGRTASLMKEILSAGMNLYVMHTNFDRADEGVNDALAELLSIASRRPLSLGLIGSCPLSPEEISKRLGCSIRVWGTPGPIRQIAIVAGSGFDPVVMAEAHEHGADAFLSAELKHSTARSAPLPCIEATHYALEAPAMKRLASREGWHYLDDPPVLTTIP